MTCRICHNDGDNPTYQAREMYFGYRDVFTYFQCSNCGCLQIAEFPENLARYYPKEYKAYKLHERLHQSKAIRYLKMKKLENSLGINTNPVGAFLNLIIDMGFIRYLRPAGVSIHSSILDVGTGYGTRLISLKKKGFTNLTGIEPFIDEDIHYDTGVTIYKKYLSEAEGQYDLVMLNHSFEHMPDPLQAMKDIHRLLKPGRIALIRIPVSDSWAWEKYGTNWMSMDPPRHFFLHTRKSMKILSDQTGFIIKEIICDSTVFQFAASEQLKQDIPLLAPNSYYNNPKLSIFTRSELRKYAKMARELNRTGRGDTACFYLQRD